MSTNNPTSRNLPGRTFPRPALVRPRTRMLAGVAEGLAHHLDWRVSSVRILFILGSLMMGAGALLYLWLWVFTPNAKPKEATVESPITRRLPMAFMLQLLAAGSGIILLFSAGRSLPIWWILLWAASIGAIIWTIRVDKSDPKRSVEQRRLVLLGGPIFLIFFGISVALRGEQYQPIESTLGFLSIIIGGVLLLTPAVSDRIIARLEEQAELAKVNQRAEIAAHLHDSVLQTLALIQNRAGTASEVGRIARAQERELRDWLYSGSAPVTQNLAAELRDIANGLELEYEVSFDLVTVGMSADEKSDENEVSAELVAAAREAMLNAAQHAGGNVSVYLEVAAGKSIEVYIRDRGTGFDPDSLPDDRFGVRSSILGRMNRAGGSAQVHSVAGQGTEVHLSMPKTKQ